MRLFLCAGLHDPRVGYWEPAKYVAKLREHKTDQNMLIFKCDMGAGESCTDSLLQSGLPLWISFVSC
jgi:protease II